MKKSEMIDKIIEYSREASTEKNKKKLERRLQSAKINLLKSKDEEVEQMLNEIEKDGAEEYFRKAAEKYK